MDSKKDQHRDESVTSEQQARREFLKNIGKATATVPAVTLLLAASEKSASGQQPASGSGGSGSSSTGGSSTGGSSSGGSGSGSS